MDIILSNTSGKPIYEQITDQVKEQIMAGTLSAGDALPSMRLLAKELRISVITTKRAYEELERAGFLENVPGKGCFVAPQNRELLREAQLRKVEESCPRRWRRPGGAPFLWRNYTKCWIFCIKVTNYDKLY